MLEEELSTRNRDQGNTVKVIHRLMDNICIGVLPNKNTRTDEAIVNSKNATINYIVILV